MRTPPPVPHNQTARALALPTIAVVGCSRTPSAIWVARFGARNSLTASMAHICAAPVAIGWETNLVPCRVFGDIPYDCLAAWRLGQSGDRLANSPHCSASPHIPAGIRQQSRHPDAHASVSEACPLDSGATEVPALRVYAPQGLECRLAQRKRRPSGADKKRVGSRASLFQRRTQLTCEHQNLQPNISLQQTSHGHRVESEEGKGGSTIWTQRAVAACLKIRGHSKP